MNHIEIVGTLADKPTLQTNDAGEPTATATILEYRSKHEGGGINAFPLVARGRHAEWLGKRCAKGNGLIIHGNVEVNRGKLVVSVQEGCFQSGAKNCAVDAGENK